MGPDGMLPRVLRELMSLQSHFQLSLNDQGNWERCLRTGGHCLPKSMSHRYHTSYAISCAMGLHFAVKLPLSCEGLRDV